jgi:hypothetical protein
MLPQWILVRRFKSPHGMFRLLRILRRVPSVFASLKVFAVRANRRLAHKHSNRDCLAQRRKVKKSNSELGDLAQTILFDSRPRALSSVR